MAVPAHHQLLPSQHEESELSNIVWIRRDFGPEELHHLGVAFENCCAAMPETKSQEFRERLALRLLNWATAGTADATHLYTRALHDYGALQRL